jgi:hypothetical protein
MSLQKTSSQEPAMKKAALLAALLLCAPQLASAQVDDAPARPLLTVSAYTGVRAPYTSTVSVFASGGGYAARQERSGSALLGVDARLRLRGPIGLVGGGVYSRTGQVHYFVTDTIFGQAPDWRTQFADAMWFAKLGLSARFERARSITDTRPTPATDLVVAAAAVRELDEIYPALNLGFQGSLPLAPKVEFMLGLDDYLVFWDRDRLTPPISSVIGRFETDLDRVVLNYSTSNIVQLRAGVSVHAW